MELKPLPNVQSFFSRFPVLDLGDYVMRDMMLSDRKEYFEMMSDPKVHQYLSEEDVPKDEVEAEREIKFWGGLFYRKLTIFWTIADKKTDKLVGCLGFNSWNVPNRRAEISYEIASPFWRQGIASKAVSATLEFGFDKMGLVRMEARTMEQNEGSQAFLKKFHFNHEGTMRNYRIIRGKPEDITLYAITLDEYQHWKNKE